MKAALELDTDELLFNCGVICKLDHGWMYTKEMHDKERCEAPMLREGMDIYLLFITIIIQKASGNPKSLGST